jgi:hypothetical protein
MSLKEIFSKTTGLETLHYDYEECYDSEWRHSIEYRDSKGFSIFAYVYDKDLKFSDKVQESANRLKASIEHLNKILK